MGRPQATLRPVSRQLEAMPRVVSSSLKGPSLPPTRRELEHRFEARVRDLLFVVYERLKRPQHDPSAGPFLEQIRVAAEHLGKYPSRHDPSARSTKCGAVGKMIREASIRFDASKLLEKDRRLKLRLEECLQVDAQLDALASSKGRP